MEPESQKFCLRWNNHQSNLISVFDELRHNENFTDLTFALESGEKIKCHKIVLAACSSFIQQFCNMSGPSDTFIVVLDRDTKLKDLLAIITYVYKGEVNVAEDDLPDFLKLAESLQVKGLNNLIEKNKTINGLRQEEQPSYLDYLNSPSSTLNGRTKNRHNGLVSSSIPHDNLYNSPGPSHNQSQIPTQGYWPIPAFPFAQHGLSPYHSQLSALSRTFEQSASPLMKKKISSMLANADTPILRTVLGQGACGENETRPRSNGSGNENSRRYSTDFSQNEGASSPPTDMDEDDRQNSSPNRNSFNTSTAREWKRYKQYTREDINKAIEAVQSGKVSALKAARFYKVPSRTLYDKVKKLGIKTPRHRRNTMTNGQLDNSSAQFPFGIGGNINGNIYRNPYSLDDKNVTASIRQRTPSPVVQCHTENENLESMVEDLSVKSRPENGVPIPPIIPKEEQFDTPPNENPGS